LPDALVATGGLGSPWWLPQANTRWPEGGTPLARFAAVVESIAVLAAINVAEFARLGAAPTALRIAGGLSRSGFLARRLAAFTGLPVRRSGAEATARGTAALAMPAWGARWAMLPGTAGDVDDGPGADILPPAGALATALRERRARLEAGYRALATAAAS
jgi:sugar (pentulose or hexulose) kinase